MSLLLRILTSDIWSSNYAVVYFIIGVILYIGIHVAIAYFLPFKNFKKLLVAWFLVIIESIIYFNLLINYFANYYNSYSTDYAGAPPMNYKFGGGLLMPLIVITVFNLLCVTAAVIAANLLRKK
ncbi:TPA: hypothetical protein DIV55_02785 [Patescibacteria group bacterium]|uniref:Uncharacterized protein n=1 Tax=Candidatus Gottesmanbacteria bacterium GW2011_GWA1_43_11 TaxID=1618436 RepID=A0A0G1CGI2_9BACT|nr:MAG: hypothetical protein UV59_C0012G0023 [Candidatus Gottesmanbacteria bacterium GW2011_GWA1_43_11]HCS78646.1 hypothetical protein [Patescibacteria group bacterium]